METIVILLIGFLFACGIYLILRRNMTRLLMGVLFLGQAANLALLVMPGLGSGVSAIVKGSGTTLSPGHPDPLPQALILTAIVIGFGMIAFTLTLVLQARRQGIDHLDQMNEEEL